MTMYIAYVCLRICVNRPAAQRPTDRGEDFGTVTLDDRLHAYRYVDCQRDEVQYGARIVREGSGVC